MGKFTSCSREFKQKGTIMLRSKRLKNSILREYYPMKTVEEVAAKVNNAKVYSALDASNGYWQIKLSKVYNF